jgi:hypothetical protein
MPITSSNWQELIVPGLSQAFSLQYGRRPSQIPALYSVRGSSRANEQHLGAGAIGSDGWADFEKTGHVQYADFSRGYKWTTTHAEFARGMVVQRKLVDDNQFGEILDRAGRLGDSAFRFREKAAAAVFNNAFTSSGTDAFGFPIAGPDAVALCSASHPRNPDDSATVDSNTSNTALTAVNVGTVRTNMMAFTDDVGDKLSVMPDEIIVPPELEDTALTIVRSALDPASANNAVNPQSTGRFTVRVWHYLTSTSNWFMADSTLREQSLIWYDRVPTEFGPETLDRDVMQFKMVAYNRFSRGWRDWRWIYGAGA